MADPADPSDRRPEPTVQAAAHRARRLIFLHFFLFLAGNLVLSARRVRDDRGEAIFIVVSHLNVLAVFYALHRVQLLPPGSVARVRASLALWLLTTTFLVGFTWKLGAMLPLGLAIFAWVMAAATQLAGFHLIFIHGRK